MKFYIASGISNIERVNQVRDALVSVGHTQTYDWTVHGSIKDRDMWAPVAHAEASGVKNADILVLLLPGGRGTHSELGIAIGAGKPIILLYERDEDLLDEKGRTCLFYHHMLVTQVRLTDDMLKSTDLARNFFT